MATYNPIGSFRKRMGIIKPLENWGDREFSLLLEQEPLAYNVSAVIIWIVEQDPMVIRRWWRRYQLAYTIQEELKHSFPARCLDDETDRAVVSNGIAEMLTREESEWIVMATGCPGTPPERV